MFCINIYNCTYKVQLRLEIKPGDCPKCVNIVFQIFLLEEIENDDIFKTHILFTDEVTFIINECVNSFKCRILIYEQTNDVSEYIRDSPKVNVLRITI